VTVLLGGDWRRAEMDVRKRSRIQDKILEKVSNQTSQNPGKWLVLRRGLGFVWSKKVSWPANGS
jgi:hypothetical protein